MAERLKDVLLVLLLALMGMLLVLTFSVSIQGNRGGQSLLQSLEEQDGLQLTGSIRPAAQPEKLALLGESGLYLAEGEAEYAMLYQQMEPLWQEALGSAGTLQPLLEKDYLAALQAPAVLLQYHAAQPLYLLRSWSGSTGLIQEPDVTGVVLTAREDKVILLITDGQGSRWQAETAASYSDLESLCATAPQANSVFARDHLILSGDEVLTRQVNHFSVMKMSAPELVRRGELSQSVQSLFGMNAYLTKVYPNADGSLVYVEGHSTINLSPNGDLSYSGEGIELELTALLPLERNAEICQQVYQQMTDLWAYAGASGQLSLEETRLEKDSGVLCFGLHQNGRFLERKAGYWANVTVENGVITGVSASLRQMEEVEQIPLLPLYQAAATVKQGRGSLRVRLLEQQEGLLLPQICFVTEE